MKKSISWIAQTTVLSIVAVAALTLGSDHGVIAQARAQAAGDDSEALCPRGNATLHGMYMSKGEGTVVGVGPIAFIGTAFFDGKGGVTNPATISQNGVIIRAVGQATYTVNSDCSATFGGNWDMRVSPDGNRLDYIETDPGTVVSGSAVRVKD